jgi:hypothetical protein
MGKMSSNLYAKKVRWPMVLDLFDQYIEEGKNLLRPINLSWDRGSYHEKIINQLCIPEGSIESKALRIRSPASVSMIPIKDLIAITSVAFMVLQNL